MTGLLVAPLGPPEHLFSLGALTADGDRVHGSMRVADWMRTDDGTPAAGVLGVLVDVVVGHATLFARLADQWAVTTGLSLEVVRPLVAGEELAVDAGLLGAESGSALSSGTVYDAAGRQVAVGTTWVRFTPGVPDLDAVASRPLADPAGATSVRAALRGTLVPDGSRVRLRLPPDPAQLNAAGVLHGGIAAAAAEVVSAAAVDDPAAPLVTAGLRASYLRPLVADGGVELVATVEHRGRTTALTTVEAWGSDGRRAVVASVTARAA